MKQVILSGNTDYGKQIGARIKVIAESLKNPIVFTRGGNSKNVRIFQVMPFGTEIMKFFTGIQVYLSSSLPTNEIKNSIYDFALREKLKGMELSNVSIFHSWDYTPKSYKYIKDNYPKIKIIQDVPIALNSINKTLKKDKYFTPCKSKVSDYILESMKYIDEFIVPSEFVKESLKLIKVKQKIHIIKFGVCSKNFRLENKPKELNPCFIGNVNYRKGISYLVTAWNQLRLPVNLNIYGRVYPEIKEYTGKNIIFHGVKPNTVLKKHNLYIFPSLFEGSSKSVYEAMACGMPVITTKNSGSIVENGKEGYVIPAQDIKALKNKIKYYYNNPKIRDKHGKAARKKAEKYTWEKYCKEVIKKYK